MDKKINLADESKWTHKAIEALTERLYLVKRRAREMGIAQPVFVLPCNDEAKRMDFEDACYRYFVKKYGLEAGTRHVKHSYVTPLETILQLEGVTVVLMAC